MLLLFKDDKKKRNAAGIVLGSVFLNAMQQMHKQIQSAHKNIYGHLQAVDDKLASGVPLSTAVNGVKIKASMDVLIASSRLQGFQHAAAISGASMPQKYGKEISSAATNRATAVDKMMARTTKRRMKADPDSDFTLSEDRSLMAARYESAQGYYQGVADAFRGSGGSGLMKQWHITSDNPCVDCEDAEDDGAIDVGDEFSNGLMTPLAHLNCQCFLSAGYNL